MYGGGGMYGAGGMYGGAGGPLYGGVPPPGFDPNRFWEMDPGTYRTRGLVDRRTIGLMLPAEVSAKKLYLELRDAATDLVLHKSPELPVDLIG